MGYLKNENKTWRAHAAPLIFLTIEENLEKDLSGMKKVLREAYPWGYKMGWPYKVWLDECRNQLVKRGLIVRDEDEVGINLGDYIHVYTKVVYCTNLDIYFGLHFE